MNKSEFSFIAGNGRSILIVKKITIFSIRAFPTISLMFMRVSKNKKERKKYTKNR
jgi:hypothetical protein